MQVTVRHKDTGRIFTAEWIYCSIAQEYVWYQKRTFLPDTFFWKEECEEVKTENT